MRSSILLALAVLFVTLSEGVVISNLKVGHIVLSTEMSLSRKETSILGYLIFNFASWD
jgi:hypothetical protein